MMSLGKRSSKARTSDGGVRAMVERVVWKPLCSDVHTDAEKSESEQVSGKKDVLGSGDSKGLSLPEGTHCRRREDPRGGSIKRTGAFEHLFRAGREVRINQSRPRLSGSPRPAACGE